ncbi:MAG: AbrB/MazE/SpoVT family DNA-binding domain-containing protein [Candidatus Aminicenantales bacterium]
MNETYRSCTVATVVTSAKGQVVIPRKERERVGLRPGMRVSVSVVEDHIEIRPLPDNPVEAFRGFFKKGPSLTKALLDDRQKERRREDKKRP